MKPNILILLTDQQRFDTLAAAGYPHMITPNLDRLVREGCTFTNGYSTNPICVPARHDLLTGAPGTAHGYFDNSHAPIRDPALPTIARAFTENGYRTALIGKSHFCPPVEKHGYQETQLMEELPRDLSEDAYAQFLSARGHADLRNLHGIRVALYHEPQPALLEEHELGPAWVGQRAAQWIAENKDVPFFLSCHWIKPHPPWNIPKNRAGLYAKANLPEPVPGQRERPFPIEPSDLYGDHDTPEEKRRIREAYFTTITMVDEAIGSVFDVLEQHKLLDRTLIIFASDHGEMLQDRGYYQKMLPFEGSARIPFVLRYPARFAPGSTCSDFADVMDLFPTCLDAAGIDYYYNASHRPYKLHGGSLLPDSSSPWRRDPDHQFCNSLTGKNRWVMMRNRRYKFIHFFGGGGVEYLYDMEADPQELHNLLERDDFPRDVYADLKARAIQMELERGPGGTVSHETFQDVEGDHLPCDWNNNNKYPRWCFNQFQSFGKTDHEADLFLKEWDFVTAQRSKEHGLSIPLLPEAEALLVEGFGKWGHDPQRMIEQLKGTPHNKQETP